MHRNRVRTNSARKNCDGRSKLNYKPELEYLKGKEFIQNVHNIS